MVGTRGKVREPDVSTPAIPVTCTTLKNGDLSLVLHVPSNVASRTFLGIHPLLNRGVTIDIYEIEED